MLAIQRMQWTEIMKQNVGLAHRVPGDDACRLASRHMMINMNHLIVSCGIMIDFVL